MSTKMSPLTDEKKDQRKQIGCMTGIFHHFLTGRRFSSHNHKKLLLAAQEQEELQHATKTFTEKEPEPQKAKPIKSNDSSLLSHSSSCSSTFSSVDSNKTARPQNKPPSQQTNIPQTQFHVNTTKEEQQSHDFRDLVKDSMYRETRGVSIKLINGERKGQAMKHIDSPRPSQQLKSEKSKTNSYERFALPRFSYDGSESRETFKSAMKLKEIPRLSLDSKASSMKKSAQEPISNFLRRDSRVENFESRRSLSADQEPKSRPRSSVIVAKLMGLDILPDTISTNERIAKIATGTATQEMENNTDFVRMPNHPAKRAAFQTEQAPWRQKDLNREMSLQSKKSQIDVSPLSSTVYGQIEKRMTQLQFQKSGKDLRALKQILEAMQKTRKRVDSLTEKSAEFVNQKCNPPEILGASIVVMKPVKAVDKVKGLSSMELPVSMAKLQKIRILEQRKNIVGQQESKEVTPRNTYHLKDQKKNFPMNCEVDQKVRASQRMTENCSTPRGNVGTLSPRLQNKSHSAIPTSNSDRVKKHSCKKIQEKSSQSRKEKGTVKDRQLADDQLSEFSSDTRYSSYQGDTASVKSDCNKSRNGENQNFVSISREDMASVELVVTTKEQPSPVSVLNTAFYDEDSPSPLKFSTVFRADETPGLEEGEWHLENLNHLIDCKRSEYSYVSNQKKEYMKNLVCEQGFTKTKPGEKAATRNDGIFNPDQSYINMILQSSGILTDTHNNYNQKSERTIISDLVNEILCRKTSSYGSLTLARKGTSPQGIFKDIHLEIDRLQKTPYYNDDDEDEGMIKLLTADMMYQTEDWTGHSSEVPAMALDIERLIFKDLINEIVMVEVIGPNARPNSHCRQLFSK